MLYAIMRMPENSLLYVAKHSDEYVYLNQSLGRPY